MIEQARHRYAQYRAPSRITTTLLLQKLVYTVRTIAYINSCNHTLTWYNCQQNASSCPQLKLTQSCNAVPMCMALWSITCDGICFGLALIVRHLCVCLWFRSSLMGNCFWCAFFLISPCSTLFSNLAKIIMLRCRNKVSKLFYMLNDFILISFYINFMFWRRIVYLVYLATPAMPYKQFFYVIK